ncbi:hypothetical protein HPP92_012192 [Vanilla planifolia]|uniref:Elongator complex protein 1 n=1 Tax=Vanilla planifolia TaxID=51239 RepID=A0A835R5M2_VANPL|nr:hypothetical protein HPP92_012192 [Vanilla planifolia]
MKNLKLSSFLSFDINLQSEDEVLILSAFDIERDRLLFASSANYIYSFQLPSSQKAKPSSKCQLPPQFFLIALEPGDFITAMDYSLDKEGLILGTSNGCLILHTVEDNMTEVVGCLEGGVNSIACSPDGALVVVTTGLGQLLFMTHDWQVLQEIELDSKAIGENNAAGDTDISSCNQYLSTICWRGDGKYFATLGGHCKDGLKTLGIWECESGMLYSKSEAKAFMGVVLDWMPSGAKVAAAYDRKAENKGPLIVFYEKNGLERNYLPIDVPLEVHMIKWNCNSDLLAISIACDQHEAIKIWFFSNNHWYLKQELRFSKNEGVKFMWDPTNPFHLMCWTLVGRITSYNFVWMSGITVDSTALIVDSSKLLVSPLTLSLMPPPMSLFTLKFPATVHDVAFLYKDPRNCLAACLSDGSFYIVELPSIESWEHFEDKEFSIEGSCFDLRAGSIAHFTWLDSHHLLSVHFNHSDFSSTTSWDENELNHNKFNCLLRYSLLEIGVACSEDCVPGLLSTSGWNSTLVKTIPIEGIVIGIAANPCKKGSAFVQMEGGSILEYTLNTCASRGSQLCELDPEFGFSASCPFMRAVSVCDNGVLKSLLFGLDCTGKLHVGKEILCSNCSSFTFYSSNRGAFEHITHLILVTKEDLLFVISIQDILHGKMEMKTENRFDKHGKSDKGEDYINIWERGAKLVGALHGDEAAVLLQTSRGNLEIIYPRKLVLVSIFNALLQRRFKDALLMVRRHRIDFNFIVDCFGWQTFVQSAAEFVNQVNNLAHVTEFVSSIKNENVIDSLYKEYILPSLSCEFTTSTEVNSCSSAAESKVNCVLQAIRKALEEQVPQSPARELCILSTLARNEPPALEEALKRIKAIRQMELSGTDGFKQKVYPSAEESLKHLLWLTDPQSLFYAALGLYDLSLAAIVALNSQKDPKEFLPYLKELEILPPGIMRYTIDLRLQRYESALNHLFLAGEDHHDECVILIKNNPQLFPLGLQLFAKNVKRREVLEAWGDHLTDKKFFQDAAAAYLCCSSLQKAIKAYRGCGDWKGVLTVAGLIGIGKEDFFQLANELCEEFEALGKPFDAARIVLEYCRDVDRCVRYCLMAREWEEALRISYMHERMDLASNVEDAALECVGALIDEYKEASEKIVKYLVRYLAVRQRRLTLAAKIQSGDRLLSDKDYDSVSETSSGFSEMSAYTARTSNNTVNSTSSNNRQDREIRRQKNKGGKIRAGSPGEEAALIEHLKGMAIADCSHHEIKSLLVVLLMLGKEQIAQQLQCAVDKFQLSHHAAVKLVEDTASTDRIDENGHTLEHYIRNLRGVYHSQGQFEVLTVP